MELPIEKRRTIISSFFITVLTAIALDNCADAISKMFAERGLSPNIDWVLPYIFIVTIIRFFMGNQLHLLNIEKQVSLSEWIWLLDFTVIVVESLLFIFIGKTCSLENGLKVKQTFFSLIIILLLVDVVWISLQILMGRVKKKWKREVVPGGWGLLNMCTVLFLILFSYENILYNNAELILFGALFTIAAYIDVKLIDHYGLLKKR